MADMKACWKKQAHVMHGWVETTHSDGHIDTADVQGGASGGSADASTVLKAPMGARMSYHVCDGVADVYEETKHMRRRETDPYGHDRLVEVSSGDNVSEYEMMILKGSRMIIERRVTLDAIYTRQVIESPWELMQQLTCFCCSCDESTDYLCRNHGYGFGSRPCEVHGVEGSSEVDPETDEDLGMPASVQAERRRRADGRNSV